LFAIYIFKKICMYAL